MKMLALRGLELARQVRAYFLNQNLHSVLVSAALEA
jgi:hypothetical protein